MKHPRSLIQPTLLPPSSVKLGRLVLSPYSPHQDYVDPPVPSTPEISKNTQSNFTTQLTSNTSTKLRSRLTALIAASRTTTSSSTVTLSAAQGTTYTLHNSGAWFRAACRAPEVREWFEGAVLGAAATNVYLVVGYHTLTDVCFAAQEEGSEIAAGGVRVESGLLGPVLSGTGAGLDADVEVGVRRTSDWAGRKEWAEGGERVWAVQYRKVGFRWFASRRIEKGELERENRWKLCWSGMGGATRGHEEEEEGGEEEDMSSGDEDEEEEEEDMLEVDLVAEEEEEWASGGGELLGDGEFLF